MPNSPNIIRSSANFINCKCQRNKKITNSTEEMLDENEYLRQNVLEPLAWAIARTFNYKPTDPKYYIAHQLLKWKYIKNSNS